MRHAAPARAGPSATLESMIAGSLIREDAARGALPLSRMGDGCRRAEIRLQRSGLLAEGRFHDGPLARGMCRPRCSARTLCICVAAHVCGTRVPTTSETRRSPFSASRRDDDARGGRRPDPRPTPSTQDRDKTREQRYTRPSTASLSTRRTSAACSPRASCCLYKSKPRRAARRVT